MPSTAAPFGFQAVRTAGGAKQPQYEIRDGAISSGYGTAIYTNQPVVLATTGLITPASATDRIYGVFAGCRYIDTNGREVVSPNWVANTAILSGTTVKAYIYIDPTIVYRVQSSAALTIASIGDQANIGSATSGSSLTGLSAATLDTSSLVGAGNNTQFRILELSPEVDNAWGDTYTNVLVQISEHAFVADRAAV